MRSKEREAPAARYVPRSAPAPAYQWQTISPAAAARLDQIIARWVGTPYSSGQRARGGGVDCVQLIAGVLDDWSGAATPTPLPRLQNDGGVHSSRIGFKTVRALRRVYAMNVVRDGTLEPGDLIAVRAEHPEHGGVTGVGARNMGHAMIMSGRHGVAVHAVAPKAGLAGVGQFEILRVYRFRDKNAWT